MNDLKFEIKICSTICEVEVKQKKIKSIRMKVDINNNITITGLNVTKTHAKEIINKNINWIERRISNNKKESNDYFLDDLINFKKVWIFGKVYQVVLDKNGYSLNGNEVYVPGKIFNKENLGLVRKYYTFYLFERFNYFCSVFKLTPKLIIKDMRSKYGYCLYHQNTICLSIRLIHLPTELIDYIIIHEFCHFKEPNHSKKFYLEVQKYCSDYKERIKELRKYNTICKIN